MAKFIKSQTKAIMKKRLIDFIDFEKINVLLEGFNKATGFVTAILDLDGNILSKSGWRTICTEFHRVHPETARQCKISDTELAGKLGTGEKYHTYKCLNGLVDVAVPIVIDGEHIANLFSGQFFFEKPDLDFFKKQAEKYKFDTKTYLEALDKVPVVSEEKVNNTMDFLLNMTNLISEMTQQKVEQKELNKTLKESDERWQFAIEENGDGLFDWNVETNEVFYSKQWKAMLGFEDDEIENNFEEWEKRIHPDDKAAAYLDIQHHLEGKTEIYNNEHRLLCKNGSYKWIEDRGKIISRTENNKPLRFIGTHRDITEQKKAKEKLTKLSVAVEQSPSIIAITDLHGNIEYVNPRFTQLTGFTSEEVIGQKTNILKSGKYPTEYYKELWITISGGFIWKGEFHNKKKSGELYWESASISPIYNDEGVRTNYIKVAEDITEQKKAEKELRISEDKFRNLYENSPFGIIVCEILRDENGKAIDFIHLELNKATELHTGFKGKDLVGKKASELVDTEVLEDLVKKYEKVVETKKSISYSQYFDIYKKTLQVTAFFLQNDKFIINFIDITEQKQAEYLVQESEEKYRALFDNAPLSYQSLDEQGFFIDINPSWLRTLGYEHDEVIGENFADFLHPDWKPHFEKNFPAFKKRGYVNDVQYKIRHKKGHFIDISFEGCIGYLPDGSFKQTYCVFQDITERKKVEYEIAQSQKRLSEAERIGKIGNWSIELATGKIEWSEGLYRIFGLNPKQQTINYELMMNCIHEEDRDKQNNYFELMQALLPGQKVETLEYRIVLPSGEIRWIEIDFESRFENNKPTYFFGTASDITERKQADEEVSKLNVLLNQTGELAKIGGWELDLQTNLFYFTDEMYQIYEITPGLILSLEDGLNLYPPETQLIFQEALADTKKRNLPFTTDALITTKQGNKKWVRAEWKTKQLNGEVIKLIGTLKDITEQKLAEEELRKSEALMLTIAENYPNSFVTIIEKDLTVGFSAGQEFKKQNLDPNQFIGLTLEQVFGEQAPLVKENYLKTFGGEETQFELFINDQSQFYRTVPLMDQDGRVNRILSVVENITKRKLAGEELRKQKEMFELVINSVPSRIFWKDLNSVYLGCNNSFTKAVKQNKIDDVIGKTDFDLIWSTEAEKYINDDKQVIKKGVPKLGYEEHYTLPDGKKVWWQSSKMPLKDNNGKIFGILATSEDVTERKMAEKAIIESEERLRLALETNNTGAWELNLLDYTSKRTLLHDQIFGYETLLPEWTFEMFLEHIIPEDREFVNKRFVEAINSVSDWKFECRIKRPDGEVRWISAIGRHIVNSNEKPIYLSGIVQDITEQKMTEIELKKHRDHLEEIVEERTTELEIKNKLLERMNKLFVGRELRMKELKEEIKTLKDEKDI
jgi:PAS domain S-box-containing protein